MVVRCSGEQMQDIPLAVLSFNRPGYLSQVLESLAAQTALNGRPVHLFQDNAVNVYSGVRYARDEDIAANIDMFKARFPQGVVHLAPHNLGIALNFLRAEQFVFEELGREVAYFFEDDMILSPHYLVMMDRIYERVRAADRVGYFAAYGKLSTPVAVQRLKGGRMMRLTLHWAFGLTRQHWRDLRIWLEPYYKLIEGHDYRQLPRSRIFQHYRSLGIPIRGTNQDTLKRIGTYALGRVGINTHACFAQYIGVDGVHFRREQFEHHGYDRTEMYPEPVDLSFPRVEQLARYWAAEVAEWMERWNERSGSPLGRNGFVEPAWYDERGDTSRSLTMPAGARIRRLVKLAAAAATSPFRPGRKTGI